MPQPSSEIRVENCPVDEHSERDALECAESQKEPEETIAAMMCVRIVGTEVIGQELIRKRRAPSPPSVAVFEGARAWIYRLDTDGVLPRAVQCRLNRQGGLILNQN